MCLALRTEEKMQNGRANRSMHKVVNEWKETRYPIWIKFGHMLESVMHLRTRANFGDDQLKGMLELWCGGKKFPSPVTVSLFLQHCCASECDGRCLMLFVVTYSDDSNASISILCKH